MTKLRREVEIPRNDWLRDALLVLIMLAGLAALTVAFLQTGCSSPRPVPAQPMPVRDGGPGCVQWGSNHYGEIPGYGQDDLSACDRISTSTALVMARFSDFAGALCDPSGLRIYWINGPIDPWNRLAGVYYPTMKLMMVRTDLTYPGYLWQDVYQHELAHHCLGQLHDTWGADEDHCWMAWSGYMPLEGTDAAREECTEAGLWPPPDVVESEGCTRRLLPFFDFLPPGAP
jgi:hypothetical protein